MNELIDKLFNSLLSLGVDPRLIVLIIAVLPIAEARLAIPVAIKCGLSSFEAFFFGFLGSSLPAFVLTAVFVPLIRKIAETKLMHRLGSALLSRIDDKAAKIKGGTIKRMSGVIAFVGVPLPLTGVWTGCAVASILELGYCRALISVLVGNLIASSLVLLISTVFIKYVNIIMAIFFAIAVTTVIILLIRAIKPKKIA